MARLEIFLPDDTTRVVDLEEETTTIGRAADNDVQIDDESISGHHAKILKKGEVFVLADLGSTNGSFLDEVGVEGQVDLKKNARIRFGKVDALLTIEEGAVSLDLPAITRDDEAPAAASTQRPTDFYTSSPFPKLMEKKDLFRIGGYVLAGVAFACFAGTLFLVFTTLSVPVFTAP